MTTGQLTATNVSYDDFEGPASRLDPERWTPSTFPLPDGTIRTCEEPKAVTILDGGTLTLRVEEFENGFDAMPMDNPKHLILSTRTFPIAPSGDVRFSVEIAAENIGDVEYSFRQAFVAFNVVDFATGSVFDHLITSRESRAVWEMLHIPGVIEPANPFTWLVERPFLDLDYSDFHEYATVFNRANRTVEWFVDDIPVFDAGAVDVPESAVVGFGLMTLMPLANGKSTSMNGQGMGARIRNLSVPS